MSRHIDTLNAEARLRCHVSFATTPPLPHYFRQLSL